MNFFAALVFPLFLSTISHSQDTSAIPYSFLIKKESVSYYLHVLASDSLEGRETGKSGQKKAAAFISAHFSSLGLTPISQGTYFQHHPITVGGNAGKNIEVNQQHFLFLKDYFFLPVQQDTLLVLDSIRFVGYGISDTEYDDYEKINVTGKAILFFDGHPEVRKKDLSSWTRDWKKKFDIIAQKKPSLVFIVTDTIDRVIESLNYGSKKAETLHPNSSSPWTPIVFITHEMALTFLPEHDEEVLDKSKSYIDRKNKPRSFSSSTSAFVHLVNHTEELQGDNVAGFLVGTDKKEEVLVISAHYDHLGKKDSIIYHGADDDGSGTAAVMELAKVFSVAKKQGYGPRRSLLFLAFSGEEKGLRGSSHYVNHPLLPLDKTVADLNIDMIGRTDEKHDSLGVRDYVYIIGSDKLSTQLHQINEGANARHTKLELDYQFNKPGDPQRFYFRSDHYNFAKNNIPIIFYFNGTHADYHRPGDAVDKIDFELLVKRTQLVFFTAWELANREERIQLDLKNDMEKEKNK